MSRRNARNARIDAEFVPPLRFSIGDKGLVSFPSLVPFDGGDAVAAWPTLALPQAEVLGAHQESVMEAAVSTDMTDIRLLDGTEPYTYHSLVEHFGYSFTPVPTLALVLEPALPEGSSTEFRFVNATIADWTTEPDYRPDQPNNELCEFTWDGHQHFLLQFLSFNIILRARRLELRNDLD